MGEKRIISQEEHKQAWAKLHPRFPLNLRIRPLLAWYDIWIGVFVDMNKRAIYILPLPCIGIVIWWN